jgi:hypothetical protein
VELLVVLLQQPRQEDIEPHDIERLDHAVDEQKRVQELQEPEPRRADAERTPEGEEVERRRRDARDDAGPRRDVGPERRRRLARLVVVDVAAHRVLVDEPLDGREVGHALELVEPRGPERHRFVLRLRLQLAQLRVVVRGDGQLLAAELGDVGLETLLVDVPAPPLLGGRA